MRDINKSLRALEKQIEPLWEVGEPDVDSPPLVATPAEVVRLELGLTLLLRVAPGEGAASLWAILGGHEPVGAPLTPAQKKQVARARQYLVGWQNFDHAERLRRRYERVPERLRLFELQGDTFSRKPVSIVSHRVAEYDRLLDNPVPYRSQPARWAKAGTYRFRFQNRYDSVTFGESHLLPPPPQHPLSGQVGRPVRPPLAVPFVELLQTARWMDDEEAARRLAPDERGNWEKRFARVRLDGWDAAQNAYVPTDTLLLNGSFHLAGMVSSGKSTLMDVLSVWAVRKGLRVVVLVGDVVGVLNRARIFARLGIQTAPLLGGYNRLQHLARLHGAEAQTAHIGLSQHPHQSFRWISTGCSLDALRQDAKGQPLAVSETPCTRLEPFVQGDSDDEIPAGADREKDTCPLFNGCPRHQAQRDAVDAPLWIGTPASFVYTRIDRALGAERVHFAEMAYRRADLLLIDEADQVQVQLDNVFNPSQTLVDGNGDGWLNRLEVNVTARMNRGGRAKLTQEPISAWSQAHRAAQTSVDYLYKTVQQNKNIHRWVTKQNSYFTDWILLHQVAEILSGGTQEKRRQDTHPDPLAYDRLSEMVNAFINDPLGERDGETALSRFAGALLRHRSSAATNDGLREWIAENRSPVATLSPEEIASWCDRLSFGLLVAVLQNSVAYLAERWADVEIPLGLEDSSGGMFHRPPETYFPLLSEPPMGQVLAFQYVPDKGTGKLRFFRCTAVGRELLLRFPDLLAQDNVAGPHTLLLSGTSWAGDSPSYHLQMPVSGVLKAPQEEVDAICRSRFFLRTFSDDNNRPIAVSGRQGEERLHALRRIVYQLTASPPGEGSLLDRYLSFVTEADRRRALFLVGSYNEAKETYEYLTQTSGLMKPGDVCYLEADDDSFNAGYKGGSLRRGVVHRFAQTGAKVLIAPLLAVERGHNILTEDGKYAAIGAAFFLVRPHPPKDDLGFAIHSINRFAVEHRAALSQNGASAGDLNAVAREFRNVSFRKWRHLLYLPIIYSTLPPAERDAMTWSQLVTLWQVIGRLVRGGCAAQVYFCDAAFRLQTPVGSDSDGEDAAPLATPPSLLREMKRVLRGALEDGDDANDQDRQIARTLYQPLYEALNEMGGL